jgi:phosphopantothenoylcysteine decarboxylase/phosphopantothenate--cysteine ligase
MNVLLGVSGGIAAYKAAELTRELQRRGAAVQVVMTAGAERFVTPLTFASLSGHQVLTSLWSSSTAETALSDAAEFEIEHIRVAQETEVLVIAPATANVIAKLAHGIADDLLTTIALATTAPIVLAPAMNVNMWNHPATQRNVQLLRDRGIHIVEPGSGPLACGMVGTGRLAEPNEIADAIFAIGYSDGLPLHPAQSDPLQDAAEGDLAGETVLITAGGTREPIDAVRYIGNHSSGKMGHALAAAAQARGAKVILITASLSEPPPPHCETIHVNTAAEMQQAVLAELDRATLVIMAAAVSDYGLLDPAAGKLKKQPSLTLELVQSPDILSQIVQLRRPGTVVIGFAAETENLIEEAHRKLREKGIDAIVANDVSSPTSGFHVDRNAGFLLTAEAEFTLPASSKRIMADRILDHLEAVRSGISLREHQMA